MTAFSRKKDADPLAPIRDGAKQEVKGRANKPTERQKDGAAYILPHQDSITRIREGEGGAMDYADAVLSLPGLALAKPLFKGGKQVVKSIGDTDMGVVAKAVKGIGSLLGKGSDRVTNRAKQATRKREESIGRKPPMPSPTGSTRSSAPRPKPDPNAAKTATKRKAADKPITDPTKQTNTNTGRAPDGGRGGAATPSPKTPKTPKNPKKPKAPPKTPSLLQRAKKLVKPAVIGGTGVLVGSMLGSEKNATPAPGSQAGGTSVNTSPDGSNAGAGAGAGMDTDLFDTPTGVTGRKPKKDPTEGGDYKSYSKDNNDFMYMTQQGYDKQEMEDMGGEKFGGRPGRGKMKTQGMNKTGKRKAGFSGKGSGAALRGF